MASKYLQKFPVPTGFQQILADFTCQVLRDQPDNIIKYASQYFQALEKGKKLEFDSKFNVHKDDKLNQLTYNPKKAEQITKKAAKIAEKLEQNSNKVQVQFEREKNENIVNQNKTLNNEQETNKNQKEQISKDFQRVEKRQEEEEDKPKQPESTLYGEANDNLNNEQVSHYMQNLSSQTERNKIMQQNCEKVFNSYDRNSNGYLESNQIQSLINDISKQINMQIRQNKEQINNFIQYIDNNHDGRICLKELTSFIKKYIS